MYPVVHRTRKFSRFNPFSDPNKDEAEKRSKKLFYSLLPSRAYINVLSEQAQHNVKDRNQWQVIYIAILGEEGSGKSVTIDCLAKWFRDYYQGRKKRYADLIWNAATARKLDYLFAKIPEGKQFIFIGCEDATGLISNNNIDLFNIKRRRWICEQRTGLSEGVIVQVLGIHDWFAVHKLLRDATSLVCAKSSKAKLNVHDSQHQRGFMSAEGVKFTQEAAKHRLWIKNQKTKSQVKAALAKFGHFFGYGTYWLKETERIGLWYNPDLDIVASMVYDLQYQRQGEEEIESELYELPEYELTETDYFHWEESVLEVILKSDKEKIKKYAKFFKAKYLDDLNYNRKETWDILKLGKSQIHKHYKDMENGQTSIGGFISNVRGSLFEQHILAVCESLGIPAEADPTITYDGYEYQDDLKLLDNFIINAKCGRGLRQYTREKKLSESGESVKGHYKATWVFAKSGFETYILYYDLETDLITVIDKNSILQLDKINVGGNRKDFPQIPLTQALEKILCLTPSLLSPLSDTSVAQESEQKKTSKEIPPPAQKGLGGDTVKEQKEED